MLIELAAADAYGASFEFNKNPEVSNDLTQFGRHGSGDLPVGAYTDDTLRTLANARVLLKGGDAPFKAENYAQAYLTIRREDGRAGWSKRFANMLDQNVNETGATFMRSLTRRPTNGALMGVAVLGFLPSDDQVRLAATMQTISTHSPSVAVYAQVVALAAHSLLYDGSRKCAAEYAIGSAEWEDDAQRKKFIEMVKQAPAPTMSAISIAAGALHALNTYASCSEVLRWACSRGGDTDSLAAVSIALASVAHDMRQDMPRHLIDNVDTKSSRADLIRTEAHLRALFSGTAGGNFQ